MNSPVPTNIDFDEIREHIQVVSESRMLVTHDYYCKGVMVVRGSPKSVYVHSGEVRVVVLDIKGSIKCRDEDLSVHVTKAHRQSWDDKSRSPFGYPVDE